MGVRRRHFTGLDQFNIDMSVLGQWDFEVNYGEPKGKVFRLETNVGSKCLKIMEKQDHEAENLFLLLEHLAHKGFKKIPRFIRTKYGEPYIKVKNRYYCISDWIYGRPLDLRDQNDVIKAVRQVALLHRLSKGFILSSENEKNFEITDWKRDFFRIAAKLVDLQSCMSGKVFLKESLRIMAVRAVISCKILNEAGYGQFRQQVRTELGFCHGSYDSHHVIVGSSGEISITGFDHWNRDIRLSDLGKFLALVGHVHDWDSEILRKVIYNYDRIYPLYPAEIDIIQAYLCFPFGYWELLKNLAKENSDLLKTKEMINAYLQEEELKQKCLTEFTH